MAEYTRLVTQMLEMFFLAHGFVIAANLLIFPITSRGFSLKHIKTHLSVAGDVISAEAAYVRSLERSQLRDPLSDENFDEEHGEMSSSGDSPEHVSLSKSIASMSQLHGSLRSSISFAKKDVGWSTISGDDFVLIEESFRKLVVTLRGMASLMPIFRGLCDGRGWSTSAYSDGAGIDLFGSQDQGGDEDNEIDRLEWKAIFSDISKPVDEITLLMLEGLRHVSLCLGLEEPTISSAAAGTGERSSDSDPEHASDPLPGSASFMLHFKKRLEGCHETRGAALCKWKSRKANRRIKERSDTSKLKPRPDDKFDSKMEQMFVLLFLQNLFHHVADIVFELAMFADDKNPRTRKKHLILPTTHRLWKLFRQLDKEDGLAEDRENNGAQTSSANGVDLARVISRRSVKRNSRSWRGVIHPLFTAIVRASKVIGSRESFFGFRVAMAVMSVILVGLLPTQTWFYNQRGLWALVFIPYSMAPNSGETISMLLFRLAGAGAALVVAIANCESCFINQKANADLQQGILLTGIPLGSLCFSSCTMSLQ